MIRRPPRSTPFPTRRSSDLHPPGGERADRDAEHRGRQSEQEIFQGISRDQLPPRCAERLEDHRIVDRSEEHTSELQSRLHLVCRLLLEKKKKNIGEIEVARS